MRRNFQQTLRLLGAGEIARFPYQDQDEALRTRASLRSAISRHKKDQPDSRFDITIHPSAVVVHCHGNLPAEDVRRSPISGLSLGQYVDLPLTLKQARDAVAYHQRTDKVFKVGELPDGRVRIMRFI